MTKQITPPAGTDSAYDAYVEHITGRSWPQVITSPGIYRTRNGKRVVIDTYNPDSGFPFHCKGVIVMKETPRKMTRWATWKSNGQMTAIGEHPFDIVAAAEDSV